MMSWTGLLTFLFLALVVAYRLRKMIAGSEISSTRLKNTPKGSVRTNALALAFGLAVVGYIFVRKVFPDAFPEWVKGAELVLGGALFTLLVVALVAGKLSDRVKLRDHAKQKMLRPKFEDERRRAMSKIEGDLEQ